MKLLSLITAVLFIQFKVTAATIETIQYGPDKKFEGFVAKPEKNVKNAPALIMIHNWMGVTNETKKQAQRFAKLGYVVFGADVYGKGKQPKDSAEAGKLAGYYKTNRSELRQNLTYALQALNEVKGVDTKKIAAVGYCFGGTAAIELARSGANITGAISFHGGLDSPTPADGKNIKAKLLALHGAIDPFVAAKDVEAFEKEMQDNKVDYQLVKYSGTVHSFTEEGAGNDITKGAAYNPSSDARSFLGAQNFLAEIFGSKSKK